MEIDRATGLFYNGYQTVRPNAAGGTDAEAGKDKVQARLLGKEKSEHKST